MNLHPLFILFLVVFCHSAACAAQQENQLAIEALVKAIEDLQERQKSLPQDYMLTYIQLEQDKRGSFRLERITRQNEQQISAELLESRGEIDAGSGLNWNSFVLVNVPIESTKEARLVKEQESNWIFQIPTPVKAKTDSEANAQVSNANQVLQQKLLTEVAVRKQYPRFTGMRIYAPEPFSPSLLAKVTAFDVTLDFDQVSHLGPLYVAKETRQLEGRYGLFISINQWMQTTLSDMHILETR